MASIPHSEPPPRPVGHEQLEGELDRMLLRFDLPGELAHLRQQPAWKDGSGPSSTTLVKHPNLRVVLVALRAGQRMPDHRTVARITVHMLEGRMRLHLGSGPQELRQGELLALGRNLEHDVEAIEDSAFLLTLAWPNPEDCK
ncbi:MAG TPA: cupin domain-containing protein [Terriglobales bacterium]|nr:cupin domain-containing protein [Terriglobales bacterium]